MTHENQSKKDYLSRYRWDLKRLDEIDKEITRCRLDALPGAITYDAMPHGSGGTSDLSDYAAKLDGLIMLYRGLKQRILNELQEILEAIEAIEEPKYKVLLHERYINLRDGKFRDWLDIGDTMGFSEDYVKHLHGSALEALKIPKVNTL